MNYDSLENKHIFITGASDGIGRSLALNLSKICKKLTLVSRNTSGKLEKLANELVPCRAEIVIHSMDLRDYEEAERIISSIYDCGEQIDVFINCAGGSHVYTEFEKMSLEDITTIFDVNAKAPIFWMRSLLPRMKQNIIANGEKKCGQVVFLSSRSGERTLSNLSIYTMAKGAIEKLCEALRNEYARNNIIFTLINPGSINTAFTEQWDQTDSNAHNEESMTVEEVVEFIIFALKAPFATNKISFQSIQQWKTENGVLKN